MISRSTLVQFFGVLILSSAAIIGYARFVPYSLAWNITASIPKGLYLAKEARGQALHRGDIACFEYKAPDWAKDRRYFPDNFPLCKYILGTHGDSVRLSDTELRITSADSSEVLAVGYASHDKAGRALKPASNFEAIVPHGEYILLAPAYKNSLDSRYLGPVAKSSITQTMVPLLTW